MACIRYNKKQYEKEVNKQLQETNRKYVEAMELYIRKKEELEELKTLHFFPIRRCIFP